MNKVQENITKSDIKPLFADDVVVITPVKATKNGKKVKKEAHVVFIFMDMLSQQPVSKVVISKTTAESLKNVLAKVLAKLDSDLKSNEMPKPEPIKTDSTKYIE
jgi:hypothetical protein